MATTETQHTIQKPLHTIEGMHVRAILDGRIMPSQISLIFN